MRQYPETVTEKPNLKKILPYSQSGYIVEVNKSGA